MPALPVRMVVDLQDGVASSASRRGFQHPLSAIIRRVRLEANSAKVAELVDALDLGSSAARRESSSLSFRTK